MATRFCGFVAWAAILGFGLLLLTPLCLGQESQPVMPGGSVSQAGVDSFLAQVDELVVPEEGVFKSMYAYDAYGEYLMALKQAKMRYGRELFTLLRDVEKKTEAATDSLAKDAFERAAADLRAEVTTCMDQLKGRNYDPPPEPAKTLLAITRKARTDYQVAVREAKKDFYEDLGKAQMEMERRKWSARQAVVKDAFDAEFKVIGEWRKWFQSQTKGDPLQQVVPQDSSLGHRRGPAGGKCVPSPRSPIGSGPAPASHGGRLVNLLALINPQRDAVRGRWAFEGAVLTSGADSVLQIPYEPPDEYDLIMEFQSASTLLGPRLAHGRTEFWWGMKGWCHTLCGFYWLNGAHIDTNPTRTLFPMSSDKRYVCEVRVRNSGVTGIINGQVVTDYRTDYKGLTDEAGYDLEPRSLAFYVYKHWCKIWRLEVNEISGRGRVIKGGKKE